MDCLFCRIVEGKIPVKVVFESESIIVFPDINPSADVHLLIVPKKHIGGMNDLSKQDSMLLAEIFDVANKLVTQYNLTDNLYRVIVNGGKAQHVPHIHFHLLGGQLKKMV